MTDSPRLLIIGAHPDDAEFHAGGLAALYRSRGCIVRMVSVTNGEAGHHVETGASLVARRRAEAAAAAARIGAEHEVWEFRDGRLEPTLELRWRIIALVRGFRPDLLLTHRVEDYHPDHRAVAAAVRDACYLVTVPAIVPEVPILRRDPVVAYMPDRFTRPQPLRPDVVIDIGPFWETLVAMLAEHASQVFEWLPFNRGDLAPTSADAGERRAWLSRWLGGMIRPRADRWRDAIMGAYGPARGAAIDLVEAFEASEYGAPLDGAALSRLFLHVSSDD